MFKASKQLGLILLISYLFINLSAVNAANGETDLQPCINQKITSSPENTQLATLNTQRILCLQIGPIEQQAFYDSCETKCAGEYVDYEHTCLNDCRAEADREREIKDEACAEPYNTLFEELTNKYKAECQSELDKAKQEKEAAEKKAANCGNGKVDEGEKCDDGNKISGDGCDSECKKEEFVPPSIPKIDTLPGPEAADVSTVSPYLMSNFLPRVAKTVISFAIGAAVLGLILSSIGLLTAYGNDEKYGNAKKGMFFSLIGLVIALLAFAIVQLVFFTGFQIGNVT